MHYNFTAEDIANITREFGQDFYEKVQNDLKKYCSRWRLHGLRLVQYFSVNCIFLCESERYGGCVLKICDNSPEWYMREYSALLEYNGRRHCRVFDADLDNGILLIEQILPGTQLKHEPSLDRRLSVFVSLYEGLHIAPANPDSYPGYVDWFIEKTEEIRKQAQHERLYLYMKKAAQMCLETASVYNQKKLLHGDLHYDNILLGNNNEYVIIDPLAFVGDPVFDIPRYLLNEYWDDKHSTTPGGRIAYMRGITGRLAGDLRLPQALLHRLFFIDACILNYWGAVDDGEVGYDLMEFAEAFLNAA